MEKNVINIASHDNRTLNFLMKVIPAKSGPTEMKPTKLLFLFLYLQIIIYATIFFDIPVARQVVGFLYLTFVPGFLIIKLLKMYELEWIEILLFSVGLSIAFLMVSGLVINEFALMFGHSQPLSLLPLILTFNTFILLGGFIVYLRDNDFRNFDKRSLAFSPYLLLFVCLPILSVVGAMWVNVYGNNTVLILMIIVTSLLFIISVLSNKILSLKLYPFIVVMFAIAVLFHSSLISNHIIPFGSDVPVEYYVFKTTENNACWGDPNFYWSLQYGRVYAMLSVTILPTIYSVLLNINPTWMFKLLFPLILAFVPLGLYQLWQKNIGKKYAFIGAFLFIAQFTFYTEILGLNRQIIAELFLALLLLVIANKKMKTVNKSLLFMIFSFALITSHYGLAEIFLFFLFSLLLFQILFKLPSQSVTVSMVVFFFVMMFAWYIFTSKTATFASILEFLNYVFSQLGDFFNIASRGPTVLTGLGMAESPSIWNTFSRIYAYLTQALIVIGFASLVTRRAKFKFEQEYLVFCSIAMFFLTALIIVPGLANTMNMTRFYHVLLFFLAPLFPLGGDFVVHLLSKHKRELLSYLLLLLILVPYFLFQTGLVYEITKTDSWSIPLSKYRMSPIRLYGHYAYTDGYSVGGAEWISQHINIENEVIYADTSSPANVLTIYGMIHSDSVNRLSNNTIIADKGVVYLNGLNVIESVIPFGELSWNSSEFSFIFDDLSMIYNNGGSEIYNNPP